MRGLVEGKQLLAGHRAFLESEGVPLPAELLREPGTTVWLAVEGTALAKLRLKDTVKDGAAEAVQRLQELGLQPLLVTGDGELPAAETARAVGITTHNVHARVHPDGKVTLIRKLQAAGAIVAMAGDGVNDAAALAQADLGIALGSGTDVAMEAADLTVMGEGLGQLVTAIRLSRATLRTIKVNLFWVFAYNTLGIPIAALGLLNPMIAGAAMVASSVLVLLNSLRLRHFR